MLQFNIYTASAATIPVFEPSQLEPAYDSTRIISINSNNATNGFSDTCTISSNGTISSCDVRVNSGKTITGGLNSRITNAFSGVQRHYIVNSSATASYVAYTDHATVNWSLGFYDCSFFSCPNTNDLHQIYTPTTNEKRKLAEDDVGNIYTWENSTSSNIIKIDASNQFASSTFTTLESHIQSGAVFGNIADIQSDGTNIYVLWHSRTVGTAYNINISKINSAGTKTNNFLIATVDSGVAGSNLIGGFQIANISNNFTVAYRLTTGTTPKRMIYWNGSITEISTLSAITTTTNMDIVQIGDVIYLSEEGADTIHTFTSPFAAIQLSSTVGGSPALIYATSDINTLNSVYSNNSEIPIQYTISYEGIDQTNLNLSDDMTNFKWVIRLYNPNGTEVIMDTPAWISPTCTGLILLSCNAVGTKTFSPNGHWENGTWTAKLWEYNPVTFQFAQLDSLTYIVSNTSSTTATSKTDIHSGDAGTALSQIDSWVAMFGIGVNAVSKFLFSLIVIVGLAIIGSRLDRTYGTIILAFTGYAMMVFIEYVPAWTLIFVAVIATIKLNLFR